MDQTFKETKSLSPVVISFNPLALLVLVLIALVIIPVLSPEYRAIENVLYCTEKLYSYLHKTTKSAENLLLHFTNHKQDKLMACPGRISWL